MADSFRRVTISIPAALKKRMDAVEDRVNWSATAAAAFEAKLLTLESLRQGTSMEAVIARLRAADAADSNEARQEGRQAGEEWARTQARPKNLRRLAECPRECQGDAEFWERLLGQDSRETLADPNFTAGFIEGAMDVWHRVKDKL